jgi:cytidyltransferase-like protein
MLEFGCIHGRFQPFHNGHYEYMLAALARCSRLVIGITQYETGLTDRNSPSHRLDLIDNPFSYWERVEIIRSVLHASEIDRARWEIVPFPIHNPDRIRNFIPGKCSMFTTVYE